MRREKIGSEKRPKLRMKEEPDESEREIDTFKRVRQRIGKRRKERNIKLN